MAPSPHSRDLTLTRENGAARKQSKRVFGQSDPIMVVDKSAAMAVNSYARLGSLSS